MNAPFPSGTAGSADPLFVGDGWSEYVFDAMPSVLFYMKDRAGRYVRVNETLVHRSGFSRREDVLGYTADELFPGLIRASHTVHDEWVMEHRTATREKLMRYVQYDGTPIWCSCTKVPLIDANDEVVGLVGISRDLPRPDERDRVYRRVAGVVEYMETRLSEPIRIPEIAEQFGLSPDALERTVRSMFDLTPKQLLTKLRLEAATRMLAEPGDVTIAAIAYACGYADQSSFSRQFKAVLSVSPAEYRRLILRGGSPKTGRT